jgi:hypothetical protein
MDTDGPPANFNLKYVLWYLFWKSPYDTLGVLQIIFGSCAGIAGGLPHPWGSVVLVCTGICTNLLARFKR